jgi:hypothetical protein
MHVAIARHFRFGFLRLATSTPARLLLIECSWLADVVLDFRHDAAGRGPAVRLIRETLVPDERFAARPTWRPKQDGFDLQLQVLVGRDANRVLDTARFQRLVDRRLAEGRIRPERDTLSLGLLAVDLGHQ